MPCGEGLALMLVRVTVGFSKKMWMHDEHRNTMANKRYIL